MQRAIVFSAAALALIAATGSHDRHAADRCGAGKVKAMLGQKATATVIKRTKQKSGASAMRVIRPGMAVTMDYSESRLNVELDGNDRIKALRCY
jgi:hypothetical protein